MRHSTCLRAFGLLALVSALGCVGGGTDPRPAPARQVVRPDLPESTDWRANLAPEQAEDRFTVAGRELVRIRRSFLPIGKHQGHNVYRLLDYHGTSFKPTDRIQAHELRDAATGEVLLPLDLYYVEVVPNRDVFVLPAAVRRLPNGLFGPIPPNPEGRALLHFHETGERYYPGAVRRLDVATGTWEDTNVLFVRTERTVDEASGRETGSSSLLAIEDAVDAAGQPVARITRYQFDADGVLIGRWPNLLHDDHAEGFQRRVVLDEHDQPVHYLLQQEQVVSVHREPLQHFQLQHSRGRPNSIQVNKELTDLVAPPGFDPRSLRVPPYGARLARRAPGTQPHEDLWEVLWPDGSWGLPANVLGIRPVVADLSWSRTARRPAQIWSPQTRDYWLGRLHEPRPVHYWLVRYLQQGEAGHVAVEGVAPPRHRWGLADAKLDIFTGPMFDEVLFHDTPRRTDDEKGAGKQALIDHSVNPVWNEPVLLVLRNGQWTGLSPHLLPFWTDDPNSRGFGFYRLSRARTAAEAAVAAEARQVALLEQARRNSVVWNEHEQRRAQAKAQRQQDEAFRQAIQGRDWDRVGRMAAWRGGADLLYYARNAPSPSPEILESGAMGLADGDTDKQYLLSRARQLREAAAARERAQREWEAQRRAAAAQAGPARLDWSGGSTSSRGGGGYSGPSAMDRANQINQQRAFDYSLHRLKWHGTPIRR